MRSSLRVPLLINGVTLVELMVMSVIASLVAITVIQGFSGISKGIIASRLKSLGTQVANEKMQIMKSTPYYRLRVSSQTVVPAGLGSLSPAVQSDDINHPPTVSIVNGITFTVYTNVQRVTKDVNESLQVVSWNNPDSGLKQITVDAVWMERNALKRTRLVNLLENSSRLVQNGVFVGVVDVAGPLPNVRIGTLEDPSLSALTDAGGNYRLEAPVGIYTLRASKRGYFPETISNRTITSISPQTTVDFHNLQIMSSGTISGTVWHNDHLVISRVCAQKITDDSKNAEYVEIYNPTTWTWTVDGQLGLMFQRQLAQDPQPIRIAIDYAGGGNTIAPKKFYLFASSPTILISGSTLVADASWNRMVSAGVCNLASVVNDSCFPYFLANVGEYDIIPHNAVTQPNEGAGVLTLFEIASGKIIDRVGWNGPGGLSPATHETNPVNASGGVQTSQVIYRKSNPSGGWNDLVGPAYDSGNNLLDLQVAGASPHFPPRNSTSAALPVQAGVPSNNAFVFANDGLSQLVVATLAGSPPEARFTLPNVATGTWTVNASTGNYSLNFMTPITHGVTVSTSLVLNTPAQYGFVSGYIKEGGAGFPALPNIRVTPGNGMSDPTGFYRIAALPGLQPLIVNPNQENPHLQELSSIAVFELAKEKSATYYVGLNARVSGWILADGITPLPGIPVNFRNQWGSTIDVTSSGPDGTFVFRTSGGNFSVQPVAAAGEKVSPTTKNISISAANLDVSVGTFTVSSNLGTLAGAVTSQGKPISTGVYILVSTGSVPADPPVIDLSFRQSGSVYNSGSSRSDGTYALPLTPGIYNVTAWYATINGNTPSVVRKDYSNIVVSANQKTTLNLSW